MKLFTPLLLCVSLAMGTIASMTAYTPRLDAVEAALAAGKVFDLGAPAGKSVAPDGTVSPIAATGARVTPELVAQLRAAGVERIRVRQFSFGRWSHAWMFAASAAGLALGAVLVRRQKGRDIEASRGLAGASPATALAGVKEVLQRLEADMPSLRAADDGMERVTAEIGELQATHIDAIVQARERIIATGGLARFAAFMSAFSVMERQINRAWSAAADDAADEVADCIQRALALWEGVERLLPRG